MIEINVSVLIQFVNFVFLMWILNIVLYRPIRNILLKRKEKIANLEQGIDTFNKGAKEKDDAFAFGIKEAREEGLKEREVLLQAAHDEERELIGKINKKIQADLVGVREKIAKDVKGIRVSLQQELDIFAGAIVQKVLGRAV